MAKKFKQGDTTDLRGYAIRISEGRVFYFNSEGTLKSCPVEEAELMHLHDLYRKSPFGPLMLHRSYTVSGMNNKNAFKSAAKKMHEGCTMSDFFYAAYEECIRQSTKPHKAAAAPKKSKFILDVYPPKVIRKKNSMRITVKFIINSNYPEADPIEESVQRMDDFISQAKRKLLTLEEFEGISFDELPNASGISMNMGSVVVEFNC